MSRREHLHGAMRDAHADARRHVRTVDQIARQTETQRMLAERIVGAWRNDARQGVVARGMLLANRLRRIPARVQHLAGTFVVPIGVDQSSWPMLIG